MSGISRKNTLLESDEVAKYMKFKIYKKLYVRKLNH